MLNILSMFFYCFGNYILETKTKIINPHFHSFSRFYEKFLKDRINSKNLTKEEIIYAFQLDKSYCALFTNKEKEIIKEELKKKNIKDSKYYQIFQDNNEFIIKKYGIDLIY